MLTMSKSAQQLCFGSRRNDNGTSGNLSVVHLAVLTGRSTTDVSKENRSNRKTGIRLNSPPPGKKTGNRQDKEYDVEKGLSMSNKNTQTTTTISSVKK